MKIHLAQKDMQVSELAELVGKHKDYMSRVVNGHCRPSFELAEKISKELDMDVIDVLTVKQSS